MDPSSDSSGRFSAVAKRIGQRLLAIGGNRVELLMVEAQEERVHLLNSLFMALGVVGFSLLAGVTFSGMIVLLLWEHSPATALFALTALYAGAAGLLYGKLQSLQRDRIAFSATMAQLKKDRECLEETLS